MTGPASQQRAAMASIPGGVFTLGQEPLFEAEAPNPPHRVRLSAFRIGVHPITHAQYRAYAAATGAPPAAFASHPLFGQPGRPVVGVSFHEALQYCAWKGGTLPTEAQWEAAARGFDERRYPWGETPPHDELACFAQNWNRGAPSEIGRHPAGASPFGCHDMAGSVWEWCLDVFRSDAHEGAEHELDPCITGEGRIRPLRGGCWRSIECKLQAAYRNWTHEVARHTTIGFRLCAPA